MFQEEFNKRVDEIEIYFNFLEFIDKIETHKNESLKATTNSFTPTRDLQKILRSNFLLILYNLVESTIRYCILSIYDDIHENNIDFTSLSCNIQTIWIEHQAKLIKNKDVKIDHLLKNIIENIQKNNVQLDDSSLHISGNLDYDNIKKIINKYAIHGRIHGDKQCIKYSIDKIKDERNKLAHGNKTFSQSGEIITIQDIKKMKECIIQYIKDIVVNSNSYIEEKKYKQK